VAMSTAMWFGQYLAGAIVSVMYAGGHFLEFYGPQACRKRDGGPSFSSAPERLARISGGEFVEVPVAAIVPDDRARDCAGQPRCSIGGG
jgi:hypothetical protein